ncbi:MAG: phosphodiesterase [Gammaproteobacteria bacterium]|nr:phosphodiesterase [Gammaproteobacteria bacterium]
MKKIWKLQNLALTSAILALSISLPSHGVNVPVKGTKMTAVEKQLGAPSRMIPPVGQPPITRWVYDDYIIYFEYEMVIHTVPSTLKTK